MAGKQRGGRGRLPVTMLVMLAVWAAAPLAAQQGDRVRQVCAECHPAVSTAQFDHVHAPGLNCLSCHPAHGREAPGDAACSRCHEAVVPSHRGVTERAPTCRSCHRVHEPPAGRPGEQTSSRCRTCHEAPHALHTRAVRGPVCTDCHTAHAAQPLRADSPQVTARCSSCHEGAHPSHPAVAGRAPVCAICHSLAPDTATVAPARLAASCQRCHEGKSGTHAQASVKAGSVAGRHPPVCGECHSFAKDPPVAGAAATISRRCGDCHEAELQQYLKGGHARGIAEAGSELPTCVNCHSEHAGGETRLSATAQCVKCHSSARLARKYNLPENVGASYVDDFHGATVALLGPNPSKQEALQVLVCADCHGAHEVGWDRATNIGAVCLRCHERGDARLAGAWLGHARVTLGTQPLIWLVRLFYFFTIPFVLLGLALNIVFHFRSQHRHGHTRRYREGLRRLRARLAGQKLPRPPVVTRFNVGERIEHFASMSTFILLLLTGLPQTRPDLGIANAIIGFFGGIASTRLIHRVVGVTFVALLVTHVTRAVLNAINKRRMPVMVPDRQDFEDTLATLRHFLQGTPKPRTGKFDFSEKFEYWGLFLGGTLMSVTGAILLFPELVTRVLPGQLVAMFRVMHGLEATFAVLVVVLWHSYGVILRPEIFPLDTSIFTGRITVERLKEEHEREYERLFPEAAREEADAELKEKRHEQ